MTVPDTDDLMLFGSLALTAIGAALIVVAVTSQLLLALGVALIVFGVPAAAVTFMAAAGETK